MREEKLNFRIILRIAISLIPIFFGMPTIAMIWCAFNIAMSFLVLGPVNCTVSSLATVGISMFFYGLFDESASIVGLFLGLEAVLCAVGCIYAIVSRSGFFKGVWVSSLGFLIPSVMSLKTSAEHNGMSIAEHLTNEPIMLLKSQLEILFNEGGLNDFLKLEALVNQVRQTMVSIVPSILVISSVVIGYIVMWCVCWQLRKITKGISHSFAQIKIPKTMVVIMLLALGIYMLDFGPNAEYISLNTAVVFASFSFFAGMSFVEFYLRRAVKNTFTRVFIHFAILMFSSVLTSVSPFLNIMLIYALVAMVDSFVNFRKIKHETL